MKRYLTHPADVLPCRGNRALRVVGRRGSARQQSHGHFVVADEAVASPAKRRRINP